MSKQMKAEIPLDVGTLEVELRLDFKFKPREKQEQLKLPLEESEKEALDFPKPPSQTSPAPATKGQKSLLSSLSKRLRRNLDVDSLTKREASALIEEMLAEIKNSPRAHR